MWVVFALVAMALTSLLPILTPNAFFALSGSSRTASPGETLGQKKAGFQPCAREDASRREGHRVIDLPKEREITTGSTEQHMEDAEVIASREEDHAPNA